jgi:hypothetical protein
MSAAGGGKTSTKFFEKSFKKGIDKSSNMCYTDNVKRAKPKRKEGTKHD